MTKTQTQKRFKKRILVILYLIAMFLLIAPHKHANAGVFDLPAFLPEGKFSLGLEPEVVTSNPAGAGINLKPKFGSNSILNWQGIIGTGSGSRGARYGLTADFDWFPDVDGGQPGIATPFTVVYQRVDGDGTFNYYFQPMVYKSFKGHGAVVYTPFIAVPFGWQLRSNRNANFTQLAFGSMFKSSGAKDFRFVVEAGFSLNRSFSYLSGGVTWIVGGIDDQPDTKTDASLDAEK